MAAPVNFSTDQEGATPIPDEFKALDLYWRAANYLSVGQIYLFFAARWRFLILNLAYLDIGVLFQVKTSSTVI